MSRFLITGGAGFIGSNLVDKLLDGEHRVVVIDNFETARRDSLPVESELLSVHEGDIADENALADAFDDAEADVVVHAAASYKDPDNWNEDIRTNTLGTAKVVQGARTRGIERLVYFQTALCYGNRPLEQPVSLDHPLRPESSYAISKTAAEEYLALSGVDFVSFRLANMYGPRNLSGPIPTFYKRLSADQACFVADTRRDFVFVGDLLEVVLPALGGIGHGYYHVSSGSDSPIAEVYAAVAAALDIDRAAEERPRSPDDAPSIFLDPSRTASDFGWAAHTTLQEGIARTVEWYRQNGVDETYTHLHMTD